MRFSRARVGSAIVGIALIGGGLVGGASAFGSQSHTLAGGTVHVLDYGDGEGAGGSVLLTGAIGDFGESISIDASGAIDPANNTEVDLALSQGSFRISVTSLDKKIESAFNSLAPNTSTCSGDIQVQGSTPIVANSGTGAYKGVSGSFALTLTIAEIGPKLKSGKCNESNSAETLGQAMIVTGSGTVSFS